MEEEKKIVEAFLTKFGNWWLYFLYILIGILAKFSLEMVRGTKISFWYAFGTTGISLFIGFLSSVICMRYNPDNAGVIVPISTLMADKIMTYIVTRDYKGLLETLKDWSRK